jgi:Uma2 family endonuclease
LHFCAFRQKLGKSAHLWPGILLGNMLVTVPTESWLRRHRLSVDDYYRMAEVGVLAPDARVELIEGEIIDMPPMGSRHAGTVTRLYRRLSNAVGNAALVVSQSPLRLGHYDEPQPDLMLLRPRADEYTRSHPTPSEVLLVIEVSDTTFRYDRDVKMPLYAHHGLREYWLVDAARSELHCFSEPRVDGYERALSSDKPGIVLLSSLEISVDLSGLFDY